MSEKEYAVLERISKDINERFGFEGETPRINYGPCGVFAYLFFHEWNRRFEDKVHICFVMTQDGEECYHVCIRLPSGELYDGGEGVHTDARYESFRVEDMMEYQHEQLEKWSYGLNRTYPRFCPEFDRAFVKRTIETHLDELQGAFSEQV